MTTTLFLVLSLFLCGVFVTADDGSKYCPDITNKDESTFVIGGSCYHYMERPDLDTISYTIARDDCKEKGAHLMIIRNEEEQNTIFSELDNKLADSHSVILGIKKEESVWKWIDGSEVTYAKWKTGTNDTFNCARMTLREMGVWETFECSLPEWYPAYVCEYNKHSSSGGHPVASLSLIFATIVFVSTSLVTSLL